MSSCSQWCLDEWSHYLPTRNENDSLPGDQRNRRINSSWNTCCWGCLPFAQKKWENKHQSHPLIRSTHPFYHHPEANLGVAYMRNKAGPPGAFMFAPDELPLPTRTIVCFMVYNSGKAATGIQVPCYHGYVLTFLTRWFATPQNMSLILTIWLFDFCIPLAERGAGSPCSPRSWKQNYVSLLYPLEAFHFAPFMF